MQPIETQKKYQEYVDKKSPNSPILKNCFNAFWVGGLICTFGQIILLICKARGFDEATSGTIVSIILIAISAFLTSLNLFNKIGKFAGAGSLVPITGFANSIVAPSIWARFILPCPPELALGTLPVLLFLVCHIVLSILLWLRRRTAARE